MQGARNVKEASKSKLTGRQRNQQLQQQPSAVTMMLQSSKRSPFQAQEIATTVLSLIVAAMLAHCFVLRKKKQKKQMKIYNEKPNATASVGTPITTTSKETATIVRKKEEEVQAQAAHELVEELCQQQQEALAKAESKIATLESHVRDYQLQVKVLERMQHEQQKQEMEDDAKDPETTTPPSTATFSSTNRNSNEASLESLEADQWIQEKEAMCRKIEALQLQLVKETTPTALQTTLDELTQNMEYLKGQTIQQEQTIEHLQEQRNIDKFIIATLQDALQEKINDYNSLQQTHDEISQQLEQAILEQKIQMEQVYELQHNLREEQEMHRETILSHKREQEQSFLPHDDNIEEAAFFQDNIFHSDNSNFHASASSVPWPFPDDEPNGHENTGNNNGDNGDAQALAGFRQWSFKPMEKDTVHL